MLRLLLPAAAIVCAIMLPFTAGAGSLTELHSLKLDVPMSTMTFPGEGADAINANCLGCHSADHVLNQPSLTKAGWEEVVNKMIKAYKAPVSSEDATAIVDYLTRTKGIK
jgi:hypothetical protein